MTDVAGLRVLIVEDELLVALSLEDTLRSLGCAVIGPVATLGEALRISGDVEADIAILDVNLRGEQVFPAAEVLARRGIPLVFCSGFVGASPLPPCFSDALQVPKPYTDRVIARAVRDLAARPSASPRRSWEMTAHI
jgi:CheY-like chemotaxis protein